MVIALKTSYMMPAHASLAPFRTWWCVATLTPRIEPRDGRAEVEVAWGGGALIGGRATLTEDSVGCRELGPADDDGELGPEDDDSCHRFSPLLRNGTSCSCQNDCNGSTAFYREDVLPSAKLIFKCAP